jgi:formylglycine-generating enzyme required for sulfatase activity
MGRVFVQSSQTPRTIIGLITYAFFSVAPATCAPVPGILEAAPAEGHSVAVDQGVMAAYQQTIPGSTVMFEMVPIPGGQLPLGSPEDEAERGQGEGPQVDIEVAPFWIGRFEVTWAEYKMYMALCSTFEKFDDLGIRPVTAANQIDAITAPSKLYDPSFTFDSGEDPRQPAVSMSQYAAKQYTKWLSLLTGQFYRLPTEAEWEYACRAGQATAYSFGEDPADLSEYGWFYDNSDYKSHPVGQKKPNGWGLYDMHGNASEWVLDQYQIDWYGILQNGKSQNGKHQGPQLRALDAICWPTTLYPRVLRGGSWNLDPRDCRSACRRESHDDDWRSLDPCFPQSPWWFASDASQDVGFRIVRPYQIPPRAEQAKYWDADLEQIQQAAAQRIDEEGRGKRGIVNPDLPAAIRALSEPGPAAGSN